MRADDERLRKFLELSYARILRTVTLAAGSQAEAEDLVQEAIVRAWERRSSIEHLDRWILTVALNLSRSRWRRVLRRAPQLPRAPAASAVDTSTVEWLLVLAALPARQRQVAVLHYVEDLPVADIATITGTSEGAVKNALFNARKALAAALDPADAEEATP